MKGKRADRPAAKKRTKKSEAKKPRQPRLPEMDDPKLDELHSLAEDYVDIRDKRIALNKEEKPLKDSLLNAMEKHGKEHYKHNGLEITVVHDEEHVKVKLTKDGGDEGDEASA